MVHNRRWLLKLLMRGLGHRRGRTVLLLAVLAMASSLATALAVVSVSVGKRVAEEVRSYGANLVVVPHSARMDVGSGGLDFGIVAEPSYLSQGKVEAALARSGVKAERSFHLRGAVLWRGSDLPVEGVDFAAVRHLFPWWQLKGRWPAAGEALVGGDLAARLKLKAGDTLECRVGDHPVSLAISGLVTTGGDEDGILFLALPQLQQALGRDGEVSQVRLLVTAGGDSLQRSVAALQPLLPEAQVKEVRQIARTSEGLLTKVKLLMLMVTAVVVICAGSSVAGTMSAAVLERGKEIGLMKAMGGTRWEVMLIFCGEAALLGVMGGVAGFVVGNGIAQFITRTVFAAPAEIVPWAAVVSLGVSVLLALLGSLGPMVAVFRLDPVRSLRGE